MASDGAVTYSELMDMPSSEVLSICDAVSSVLDQRHS